jgi:hypothetical protein
MAYREVLMSMLKRLPLAAWKMVAWPKSEGGLRFIKLGSHNKALMKSLHKVYNRVNISWVKLIWES